MRNIDKIKQMQKEELIELLVECSCDHCAYNGTNCMHDMCTIGITKWLEQEAELTPDDIRQEYDSECSEYPDCIGCRYFKGDDEYVDCYLLYMMDNFNIENGKITRRKEDK